MVMLWFGQPVAAEMVATPAFGVPVQLGAGITVKRKSLVSPYNKVVQAELALKV